MIATDVLTLDTAAPEGFWRSTARRYARSRLGVAAAVFLLLLVLLAVFAPWIAPQDPYDLSSLSVMNSKMPPMSRGNDGLLYLLGSDQQGREMASVMMYGLRVSLFVSFTSVGIALAIGIVLGLLAGFSGGLVDAAIMRVVDVQLGIPAILLAIIILALLGQGIDKTIAALILTQYAYFTRTVRGAVLVERQRDYVLAAQGLDIPYHRVLLRHVLPNCLPPVIVVATLHLGGAIALEATLSFLGLGVPVTRPSLGMVIANGFQYLLSGRYWIALFPGFLLMVLVIAINLVGDRLRDILNPRLT
jgi:peptide/nickel transport system permease protein